MIAFNEGPGARRYVTGLPPGFPNHRDQWVQCVLLRMATLRHGSVGPSWRHPGHTRRLLVHRIRIGRGLRWFGPPRLRRLSAREAVPAGLEERSL